MPVLSPSSAPPPRPPPSPFRGLNLNAAMPSSRYSSPASSAPPALSGSSRVKIPAVRQRDSGSSGDEDSSDSGEPMLKKSKCKYDFFFISILCLICFAASSKEKVRKAPPKSMYFSSLLLRPQMIIYLKSTGKKPRVASGNVRSTGQG